MGSSCHSGKADSGEADSYSDEADSESDEADSSEEDNWASNAAKDLFIILSRGFLEMMWWHSNFLRSLIID